MFTRRDALSVSRSFFSIPFVLFLMFISGEDLSGRSPHQKEHSDDTKSKNVNGMFQYFYGADDTSNNFSNTKLLLWRHQRPSNAFQKWFMLTVRRWGFFSRVFLEVKSLRSLLDCLRESGSRVNFSTLKKCGSNHEEKSHFGEKFTLAEIRGQCQNTSIGCRLFSEIYDIFPFYQNK